MMEGVGRQRERSGAPPRKAALMPCQHETETGPTNDEQQPLRLSFFKAFVPPLSIVVSQLGPLPLYLRQLRFHRCQLLAQLLRRHSLCAHTEHNTRARS